MYLWFSEARWPQLSQHTKCHYAAHAATALGLRRMYPRRVPAWCDMMGLRQTTQRKPAMVIRTEIVGVITPSWPPCAVARDVRPEREQEPDGTGGAGPIRGLLLTRPGRFV